MDKIGLSIQQIQVEGINLGQVTDTVSCIGNLYTYEPMLNRLIRASHCLSLFPSFFPSFLPACLPFFLLSFLPFLLFSFVFTSFFPWFLACHFLRSLFRSFVSCFIYFFIPTLRFPLQCAVDITCILLHICGSCEGSYSASKRILCASFDGGWDP